MAERRRSDDAQMELDFGSSAVDATSGERRPPSTAFHARPAQPPPPARMDTAPDATQRVQAQYQEPVLLPYFERAAARLHVDPAAFELRWARQPRRPLGWVTRSTRLASIRLRSHQIRVHPIVDDRIVPRSAIEYLLYHELCHAIARPRRTRQGTWSMHHQDFRVLEHAHPAHESSVEWFRANLAPRLQARRIAEMVDPEEARALLGPAAWRWFAPDLLEASARLRAGEPLKLGR